MEHVIVELFQERRKSLRFVVLNIHSSPKNSREVFDCQFTRAERLANHNLLTEGDFNAQNPA